MNATLRARNPVGSVPRRLRAILSLEDFEAAARRHLPRPVFGYVSGGCETDLSLRGNRQAFDEYGFVPRVLQDVSQRSQTTSLFGHAYSSPFGIAPMGLCALSAYRGDLALARVASEANIPMIVSATSLIALEDIAQVNPDAWFQAYVPGEPARIEALLERVARAGYKTLVVTADTPVSGNRENNLRLGFSTPLRPGERWKGVLIVKGLTSSDDACAARDCGADGIIVSNDGGRQLDGAVSPLQVLPAIVAAVTDIPVMMDSGVRRGNDVLKAMALGAKFVFLGRPFNYAAAIAGEAGVRHAIDIIAQEIMRNMALLGISRLEQMRDDRVVRR